MREGVKMGTFGVKRASDEYFCPSTVLVGTALKELMVRGEAPSDVLRGGNWGLPSRPAAFRSGADTGAGCCRIIIGLMCTDALAEYFPEHWLRCLALTEDIPEDRRGLEHLPGQPSDWGRNYRYFTTGPVVLYLRVPRAITLKDTSSRKWAPGLWCFVAYG